MKKRLLLIMALCLCLTACGNTDPAGMEPSQTGTDVSLSNGVYAGEGNVTENGLKYADGEPKVIEKIEGLPEDFYFGFDVSSYAALKDAGVKYYDFDSNELSFDGFFEFLKNVGVNCVRLRLWNDPYNEEKQGYGGGNCGIENTIRIGEAASKAGLNVLIDFHYSDFWADPARQLVPKAWQDMEFSEKKTALYEFTKDSLKKLIDNGVNITMVQVGNETNNALCGEKEWKNICALMNAGSKGVREVSAEYDKDIKVVLHFADPQKRYYVSVAETLKTHNVDYDVFASSYYPFWHGTLSNLSGQLEKIATTYDKKVMIAEFSMPHTLKDMDGTGNNISEGVYLSGYEANIYGQMQSFHDATQTIASVTNGIGIFYWEPAWLPVNVYDYTDKDAEEILKKNRYAWETYGAGWASSAAKAYDPVNVGDWYGGSSWDNMGLFDENGHPLESLKSILNLK